MLGNKPGRSKEDRLVLAAGKGNSGTVKRLLKDGADVEGRCPPPLGEFNNGKAEVERLGPCERIIVRSYFDRVSGWPVHRFTRTALQAAAEGGHEDVVRVLLDAGAGVNAPAAPGFGRTALQAAAEGGHHKAVALLIKTKADANAQPAKKFGRTALQAAVEGGMKRFLSYSQPLARQTKTGNLQRTISWF